MRPCSIGLPILLLAAACAGGADALEITEFMADNRDTLADQDGDFEDWIEIHNPAATPVSLEGWYLTDSASDLTRWRFPAVVVTGGGYRIVFASNKNRRDAASELHTNFKLAAAGEYLALVHSNLTVVSEFAPTYPPQIPGASYGRTLLTVATSLVQASTAARVRVPQSADAAAEASWKGVAFDDSVWSNASASVGFETGTPEFGGAGIDHILAGAPAGYWRLNETNGTVAYNLGILGEEADGLALNGATQRVAGVRPPSQLGFETNNAAARFVRASNHKVDVPYNAGLNTPSFSFELWARPLSLGVVQSPLTCRDTSTAGYYVYLSAANSWSFLTGNGSGTDTLTAPGSVSTGVWYHLVGSYDADTRVKQLYVNGVFAGAATNSVTLNAQRPLRIGGGRSEGDGGNFFNGDVDEVAVYARALSFSEVTSHYARATAGGTNGFYAGHYASDLRAPMHGSNATAWLRIPFVVTNPASLRALSLRLRYDDGFAAWLNGLPVASAHAPVPLTWTSRATAVSSTPDALIPELFRLDEHLDLLSSGTNLLALQALNVSPANPDLLLNPLLEGEVFDGEPDAYFTGPTPGAANGAGLHNPGPLLYDETCLPIAPTTNDDLVVTIRAVPSLAPISTIVLRWRVMFGAVASTNLADDGLHGDGVLGDGVYGAVLPRSAYGEGQMVRWQFVSTDTAGRTNRWPLFPDPLNSPADFGTMIADGRFATALPVWHWFASDTAAAATRTGTRGAVWYGGAFYDNVFIRLRGGATSVNSKKFDFNTGYHCRIDDVVGRVEEANLNGGSSYDTTLTRPPLAFETLRVSGHPAEASFSVLLRVNSGADRVGYYVEQIDERFLDRWDLDRNGALYKFDQRGDLNPAFSDSSDGVQKRTRLFESNADLQLVVDALTNRANRVNLERFLFDNFDLANVANYLACRALFNDFDDCRKNWYVYRDTERTREWMLLPWDKDGTFGIQGDAGGWWPHPLFGDEAHLKSNANQWSLLWDAIFNTPRARDRYLRRLRTVMDQQLQTAPGYLEARANALWAPVYPHRGGTNSSITGWLPTRRAQLYNTYSITNASVTNRLIPLAQSDLPAIRFGAADVNPASGSQAEEYVELLNTNAFSVDLSGWSVSGGIAHTFRAGTVILPGETMFLARDAFAFRGRASSPKGGEFRYVQGNYAGALSARGETLALTDDRNRTMAQATFAAAPTLLQQFLRITEIHFHPPPTDDAGEYEFIELRNISATDTLNLTGVGFSNGVSYVFGVGVATNVPPGGFVLLVRNPAAFAERYPTSGPVVGVFTGSLDNAGENLRLHDAVGEKILDFSYGNRWSPLAEGLGFSLVIRDDANPWSSWGSAAAWRASAYPGGSPGAVDPDPLHEASVWINEVLTHTDPPLRDAVEIFNAGPGPVDLGGWFLSDDAAVPWKFRIPTGTVLGAGSYVSFEESHFNSPSNSPAAFNLSSTGEDAWLFSADAASNLTGLAVGQSFGAAFNAVSFGRYVNSVDDAFFIAQRVRSLAATNDYPAVGPVVISEVMYAPVLVDTNSGWREEYIELHNPGAAPEPLFDPLVPTNRWTLDGAVRYTFPTGALLAAGGRAVVVGFNSAMDTQSMSVFRGRYGMPTNVLVFGPWTGALDNAGERLELRRPDAPNSNAVPSVLVESVTYVPTNPWPPSAAGQGAVLQRIESAGFSDDPINWYPAPPSPGAAGTPGADADADGQADWLEWLAGTNPSNALSRFEFTAVTGDAAGVRLEWPAAAGKRYAVDRSTNLLDASAFVPWRADIFATGPTGGIIDTDEESAAPALFRVRLTRP